MKPNKIVEWLAPLLAAVAVALATPSAGAQDTAGFKWRPTTAPEARRTDDRYVLNVVGTSEFWSQPRVFGAELTLRY